MIKKLLREQYEKLTGRKCSRCIFNRGGRCNLNRDEYMKCFHSITLPNFQKRPPRYLRTETTTGTQTPEFKAPPMPEIKPAPLTVEQEQLLKKIRATLQDAEDIARESGLLTED